MKKIFLSACISLISISSLRAQEQASSSTASVEKSIFGVQTGFLGVWVNNEMRLTNSIALRTELGMEASYLGDGYYNEFSGIDYAFLPVINVEPRWYYNLKKRQKKGRKTFKNNGNFVGLKLSYSPDLFAVTNIDNVETIHQILIIPKWAIRRTIGKHFTYEAGIGIGYWRGFFDEDDYFFAPDKNGVAVDLHIRLGYTF